MKYFEPPIAIPTDVVEAARTLETFFALNYIEDWALMGVCSRNMYEKLKASAMSVTTHQTLEYMATKQ